MQQEVITKEDADREIQERKAVGLEARTNERHQLRMQWYRERYFRQAIALIAALGTFVAIVTVAAKFDWWTAVTAGVFAGGMLILINVFGLGAMPPEER